MISTAALAVALSGCVDYLEPGDLGQPRYLGEIRGEAPLRMIPPTADRSGNVYVLYGDRDLNDNEVYVGHAGGGWSTACQSHRGDDRGVHGWVGHATSRAWFHAGDGLVEVDGDSGKCGQVLATDPASNAALDFLGVLPLVRETPSRTWTVALIASPEDNTAYFAVIDLERRRYFEAKPFEPSDARDIKVLGSGADAKAHSGMMLVSYTVAGETVVEGLFLNDDADVTARIPVAGISAPEQDMVVGQLQTSSGDLAVGLLENDQMVAFHRTEGGVTKPAGDNIDPVGIHKWQGKLYLVGTGQGGDVPAITEIDQNGNAGSGRLWESSQDASLTMGSNIVVIDDRTQPMQRMTWQSPASAISEFPFLSPHSLSHYANDTTIWLIAGPSFNTGGSVMTSVAFAPIGISYR
jgi:hypothetical protein